MHPTDDEKVVELLQRLPKVEGETSNEELYRKVSIYSNTSNQRKRWIPFVAFAIIFLLILGTPFFLFTGQLRMTMEESAGNEEADLNTVIESSDMEAESVEESELMIQEDGELDLIGSVLYDADDEKELVHFALFDESKRFVIPLVISASIGDESIYNRMNEILQTQGLLPDDYHVDEIEWDREMKQVRLKILDHTGEIDIDDESLLILLEEMFAPSGFEHATLELITGGEREIRHFDLIGYSERKATYMLYQGAYYVLIPQKKERTIAEALKSLQQPISAWITNPMSPDIDFSVVGDQEQLVLHFSEGSLQADDITITMVESILLTAKRYGYSEVVFGGMPLKQIGSYDFSEPIPVPFAANPLGHD